MTSRSRLLQEGFSLPPPECHDSLHSCNMPVTIPNIIYLYNLWEKAMAPHSSTLAWKIPWTEEPGRLQSMRSLRVTTEWLHFHFSLSSIGERNGNPLQCSCLENPRDGVILFSLVTAPIYIPTSSVCGFSFLHILSNIYFQWSFWW